MNQKEKIITLVNSINDENVLLLLYTFTSAILADPETIKALSVLFTD